MHSDEEERHRMVKEQLEARHKRRSIAGGDANHSPASFCAPGISAGGLCRPRLPSYAGQTISQPYIVALMTELLHLTKNHNVLEIGTGTGYQTVILAELAREVYTMEINPDLYEMAKSNPLLKACSNIHFIHGNGYRGYPPAAPYDAVIVTAAPPHIPQELVNQLAPGGRMVIPVGDYAQELQLITKNADNNVNITPIIGVRFVHMTGEP